MSSSLVPTVEDVSELGGCDIVDEEAMGNVLGISTGFCVCVIQGVNCF